MVDLLLFFIGASSVLAGVAWVYPPAGLIVGGLALCLVAVLRTLAPARAEGGT